MSAPAYPPTIKTQPLARDGSLSFYWYPATQSPDTWGYNIYDQNSTLLASVTSTVQTTTVTGLTNGQTYECYLMAANIAGESPPAYFRPFQPGLPPTVAPTSATATKVGDSNALIEWTPSGESLVAPIQWYVIKAVSSDPAASNFRYTADGLLPQSTLLATNFNPYSYTFTVQGVNCPGYSPAIYTSSISFVPPPAGGSWRLGSYGDPTSQQELAVSGTFTFQPGTGSYTVEFFFYIQSYLSTDRVAFLIGEGSDPYNSFQLLITQQPAGGKPAVKKIEISGQEFNYPTLLSTGQWYHVAVSRDGGSGNTRVWLNGTSIGTATDSTDYNTAPTRFLYNNPNNAPSYGLNGYITNLNFVSGAYTYNPANTTITVPTSPLTSNANTTALWLATDAGNIYTDSGPNGFTTNTTNANGIVWASNSPF